MKTNNLKRRIIWVFLLLGLFFGLYFSINFLAWRAKIDYWIGGSALSENSARDGITLEILKIGLTEPIVIPQSGSDLLESLKNGVVLHPELSRPQEEGTSLIFGHSSDFFWRKGNAKTAFALLSELESNDKISIIYQDKGQNYEVRSIEKLFSWEFDIREYQDNDLILMTCWPIGTNLKRLIIIANKNTPPVGVF